MSQGLRPPTQLRHGLSHVAAAVVLTVSGCNRLLPTEALPEAPSETLTGPGPSKDSPTIRYQSYSRLFVSDLRVGALAALPDRLLATTVGPAPELIAIDGGGKVRTPGIRLDAPPGAVCQLAISPGYHPGFPEGDVLVSVGSEVRRVRLDTGAMTPLATLPVEDGDVTGMCFDPLGGFEHFPLVLAEDGWVYRVDAGGALLRVGFVGAGGRGTSFASTFSGGFAGQLLVAFPVSGDVVALSPTGRTTRVTGWSGVSGAYAVPDTPLPLFGSNAALFVAVRTGDTGCIVQCALDDIVERPGALLLTSLYASGSGLVTPQYGGISVASWSRFMGAEVAATFVQRPAVAHLELDVRPGAEDTIVLGSATPIAVAFLSSPLAVPSNIDASTLTLAGAAALPARKGTAGLASDLNADGVPDLLLWFRPADMELVPGAMTLSLHGAFFDGARLRGEAAVQVLQP